MADRDAGFPRRTKEAPEPMAAGILRDEDPIHRPPPHLERLEHGVDPVENLPAFAVVLRSRGSLALRARPAAARRHRPAHAPPSSAARSRALRDGMRSG